jgi:putative DNA methylase
VYPRRLRHQRHLADAHGARQPDRSDGTNALASSIVLVCRKRPTDAPPPPAASSSPPSRPSCPPPCAHLQRANIAPVDLAQAAIGPGMAVFTRYAQVLDAEGKPISVRAALALINQTLDEALAEQEGDFDADSRWALAWFEQHGFAEGEYGVAETLSKAKNTSVAGMVEAGILESRRGKVRLLKPRGAPRGLGPVHRPAPHRLGDGPPPDPRARVRRRGRRRGAGREAGARAETARELAYRLYTLCERKKRAAEASPTTAWSRAGPRSRGWRRRFPTFSASRCGPLCSEP